jgi:hypothetical protein
VPANDERIVCRAITIGPSIKTLETTMLRAVIIGLLFFPTQLLAAEPIRHSLFIAGPNFTGIIDEEGKAIWNSGKNGARDGFVLPSGNLLIAWSNEAKEFTRDKKVVWEYKLSADNRELGTLERLENGNTLLTELGPKPRLLEVTAEGKIAVEFPLLPETDNAHMQTRMAPQTGERQLPGAASARVQSEGIYAGGKSRF